MTTIHNNAGLPGEYAASAGATTSPSSRAASVDQPSESGGDTQAASSTEVRVSDAGRALAAATGLQRADNRNADIDSADLSGEIKELLKRIRELQEQLREKQRELAAIQADQSLTPEQQQAKAQGVQAMVGALSAALSSAMSTLSKLMADQKLTDDQKTSVAGLLMAG